jgi:pyruvate dehydrogenase E2 component (dihydrolipoamide acetyltransferase)
MPIKILMPALSPTMTHGNLAKWVKRIGDKIKAGEVIAEIETDKATMEVEAVDEGILAQVLIPEGTKDVAVNALIAVIAENEEDLAKVTEFIQQYQSSHQISQNNATPKAHEPSIADTKLKDAGGHSGESITNNEKQGRIVASPLAKKIAQLENIDLASVNGTGPYGRIIKADILHFMQHNKSSSDQSRDKASYNNCTWRRNKQEYNMRPVSNMRRIIANRLQESKATIPHFYLNTSCIIDNLLAARQHINDADKERKISINDLVILAAAKAIHEIPEINCSWIDESSIRYYNNVDISVAVSIEDGLITPIIKNADHKNIYQISDEMKHLAARAKSNNLKPEEFQGGSITISNLGMYGVESFQAIINPPQSCILSVGASAKQMVIINDKPEVKSVMQLGLSCDHRVVDGVVAAKFLMAVKKFLEAPILMFL